MTNCQHKQGSWDCDLCFADQILSLLPTGELPLLTDEQMQTAILAGVDEWHVCMEDFWDLDNQPYPENEEYFIRKAIAKAQRDLIIQSLKGETK